MRSSRFFLIFLATGCSRPLAPGPSASPSSPPLPEAAPALAPWSPPPIHVYPALYCVIRDGRMENVVIDPRDSTYQRQPITQAFPADSTYALNAPWWVEHEPLDLLGSRYLMYGLPRILGTNDVVSITEFRGVPVFAEPTADPARPEVIYIPVRPGCEFQPYTRLGRK